MAFAARRMVRGRVAVLMLHRFGEPGNGPGWPTPHQLRALLDYARRHRYRIVSLADLLHDDTPRSSGPAIAFTVDDGYADFAELALPVFQTFDCPVTLFVTTGFLDGTSWFWWDQLEYVLARTERRAFTLTLGHGEETFEWDGAVRRTRTLGRIVARLKTLANAERERAVADIAEACRVDLPGTAPSAYAALRWVDLRNAAGRGVSVGPHSVTHPILSACTDTQADWEIRESWARVRSQVRSAVPVFCYPNGDSLSFGDREVQALQRAGLELGVSSMPGYAASADLSRSAGPARRYTVPRFACPSDLDGFVQIVSGIELFKSRFLALGR